MSIGYGHLEKIVNAYSQWRASHSEIAKIEEKSRRSNSQPREIAQNRLGHKHSDPRSRWASSSIDAC